MHRLWVLLSMILCVGTAGAGEVHRWIGPDGQVVYGDQPPTGQKTEKLDYKTPPQSRQSTREDGPEAVTSEVEGKNLTDDQLMDYQCKIAKAALARYESAPSLLRTRPDGSKEPLLPAEREATIEAARANVANYCVKNFQSDPQ